MNEDGAWGPASLLRDWGALLRCYMRHKRGMLKQGAESRGPQLLTPAAACLRPAVPPRLPG